MNAVLLAAVVLTAALALGVLLLLRTRLLARRSAATAYFAAAVACAALAGSLGTPAGGAAARASGGPVLGSVGLGGKQVPVLVVPNRPGFNLVAVAAPDASAGTGRDRLAKGGPRPGSALTWIPVELPAGPGQVWVSAGGAAAPLSVDTGRASAAPAPAGLRGADGPECASAAAGAVLGGSAKAPAGCPSDALPAADAAALRETVGFLAGRGTRAVSLVEDDSPRGRAAAAEVRASAARAGLSVQAPDASSRRPLLVTSGWAGADAAVHDVEAGRTVAEGTYLAPWLLTAPLLSPSAGQLIPLRYAPNSPAAVEYAVALGDRLPGEVPSAAGYEAWRTARGAAGPAPAKLYAAAVLYVPGSGGGPAPDGSAGGGHHHGGSANWLPSGMIVPVAALGTT
ncbi:hypothetical protein BX286_6936 [Streptomyces sp. 3211.6]|uniref:hypothetical protein n=1 Tax=Streptomyces sp. 3211.6 TaxID=1938845 RepID=UPI000EAFFB40|nr:hypothetical protein [Streptomyces sp. 3211.6]RKS97124.1 hypothetical protein BX286_6936 [Streptomyces sp. 3211.6]